MEADVFDERRREVAYGVLHVDQFVVLWKSIIINIKSKHVHTVSRNE